MALGLDDVEAAGTDDRLWFAEENGMVEAFVPVCETLVE